jgi:hypothetical protein
MAIYRSLIVGIVPQHIRRELIPLIPSQPKHHPVQFSLALSTTNANGEVPNMTPRPRNNVIESFGLSWIARRIRKHGAIAEPIAQFPSVVFIGLLARNFGE